jgi:hypothetical protein
LVVFSIFVFFTIPQIIVSTIIYFIMKSINQRKR